MQKLLSIVVPVYKVEQYINKCLDSCVLYKTDGTLDEEKMNLLEVIIVNDGTPDNSAELSREYTVRYPKTFRQIDKENGGHGSAWNVGLKEAKGKYLRFLDSDDWLTNLDKLMELLATTDADVVLTHLSNYHEDTQKSDQWIIASSDFGVVRNIDDFYFEKLNGKTNAFNFWFSTYKTSLLKPLQPLFMEKVMYDDSILYAIPLLFAQTYIAFDLILYNYLTGRVGQSMNVAVKKKNIVALQKTYQYEMEFISKSITQVNSTRKNAIERIMASDSIFLLTMLVYLPWKEFSSAVKSYPKYFHLENLEWKGGNQAKRFVNYPLLVFYLIEKLRQRLNK